MLKNVINVIWLYFNTESNSIFGIQQTQRNVKAFTGCQKCYKCHQWKTFKHPLCHIMSHVIHLKTGELLVWMFLFIYKNKNSSYSLLFGSFFKNHIAQEFPQAIPEEKKRSFKADWTEMVSQLQPTVHLVILKSKSTLNRPSWPV